MNTQLFEQCINIIQQCRAFSLKQQESSISLDIATTPNHCLDTPTFSDPIPDEFPIPNIHPVSPPSHEDSELQLPISRLPSLPLQQAPTSLASLQGWISYLINKYIPNA